MGKRLRICFVLDMFYPHVGGVETAFYELTRRLVERDCEVRVLTCDSSGGRGRVDLDGVMVHYLPWRTIYGHAVPQRRDLTGHVQWCDIVHTTTYTAAPAALRVARWQHRPCVLTVNECLGSRWSWVERDPIRAFAYRHFERRLLHRPFTTLIAISAATRRDLLRAGVPADRVRTVHLGIDHDVWHPSVGPADICAVFGLPRSSRVFLFAGRAGRTKGADLLLAAIERCAARLPLDVRFAFLLGAHPPGARERFCRAVARSPAAARIAVRPSVPRRQLPGIFRAAHCVVVPSMTEGFGFCAAEAVAVGTGLLASDAGSLPEVVSGRSLVFRNRDVDDLAEKLLSAAAGRFDARPGRTFSWDDTADRTLAVYDRIMTARR